MKYDRIKKAIISLALTGAFIISAGMASTSVASAQYRSRDWGWRERHREHEELERIRRFDRERQLRYRTSGVNRLVGYYDRLGRFHAYGFYDRFGRFHRY